MVEVIKIGEMIDKLIGCDIKAHYFHHKIIDEEKKKKPNTKLVMELDKRLRIVAEERVALKNAIDMKLKEIIEKNSYDVVTEERTYTI